MSPEAGGKPPPGGPPVALRQAQGEREAGNGAAAARQLAALLPPLRFAARDDFAALPRLTGFEELLRTTVARARRAGAPESAALSELLADAEGFDALDDSRKRRALARIAAHLATLVPVPREIDELARRGRVEAGRSARGSTGSPRTEEGSPPAGSGRPEPVIPGRPEPVEGRPTSPASPDQAAHVPPPRTAAERESRRAKLRKRLADLARAHPAPRGQLEERGYLTVEQALSFWPKAYQDRSVARRIADLRTGDTGIAVGKVAASRTRRMRSGKPMVEVDLADASGRMGLVFFNPPSWRLRQFAAGETVLVSGKVTEGFGGRRQMAQPEIEKLQAGDSANFGRIVPVYAGPADYQHPALRKLMKRLCDELAPFTVDDLPEAIRERRRLLPIADALRQAHFPPPGTDPAHAAERATPAFRRLVFEELFFLQLAMALRRQGVRRDRGIAFEVTEERIAEATAMLPFQLTGAQRRALDEIARDMARPDPMNRLLQGDVGSGKTAVAFAAMVLAVRSGFQAALMAPTELLAQQHARTFARWLEGSGIEAALIVAQARGRGQREARAAVTAGQARIVVGTHALLEQSVGLDRLGLVVVDEQHRFGVMQRARLIAKGNRPDVLVMTATPIPRTLALAFYGDLDQSKIDQLPPGRAPVETRAYGDSQRRRAYEVARGELAAGRQAYVVYPLVEESEKSDLADATTGAAELVRIFAPHSVGLVHGQMKADEKDAVMARFRAGELAVLVATTVIEVGVDVPNATVMIVEHAERFGLSQLHQLRGRVGRGAAKSHCLLLAHFKRAGDEARDRLRVMESTQDGFEIARADLRLRGPGELLGTRQSGQKLFDIADLYRDEAILDEAREEAFALVRDDPGLTRPEHAAAAEALAGRWADRLSLAQIG